MAWDLSGERPIYIQLVERISRQIASGAYKPGDKFPSVRELALEAAVNPNTMQRAMAALEADGLLITSRTSGRTVTEDMTLIESVKKNIAVSEYNNFYNSMKELGYSDDEILRFVKETKPEAKEGGRS